MDKIIEAVGPYGIYQKSILFLVGFCSALSSITVYNNVFIAAEPELICKAVFEDLTVSGEGGCKFLANSNYSCRYDDSYYGVTMINEWNLICEKKYLASLLQSSFFFGTLICIFAGYFSDKFGRRRVTLIIVFLTGFMFSLGEIIQLNIFGLDWYTKYIIYSGIQIVLGVCSSSLYSITFLILMELTTPVYNTLIANLNLYMYIFGELMLMVVAYFSRNWHTINIVNAAYSITLFIFLCIFLPESPRYLVEVKKYDKAVLVLKNISRINRSSRGSDDTFEMLLREKSGGNLEMFIQKDKPSQNVVENTKNGAISYLFNDRHNFIKTILILYVWFALNLVYYGVSIGITSVGESNPYLMYFMSGIAEFIGYTSCLLNDKYGRKKMFIIFLAIAGVVCFLVSMVPVSKDESIFSLYSILLISLVTVGKASTSAAYNSTFIYTSLFYPTSIRSTLLLFISGLSRAGSLISPQINLLGYFFKPLPYFVFGFSSILACVSVSILPNPEN